MRETFKGFLVLRLVGLAGLAVVVAVVLGIRSLTRGSVVVGLALLLGGLVFAVAVGSRIVRRSRGR